MIVLLDGDGPLFDLTGETVARVNDRFGHRYSSEQWTEWHATFMAPEHVKWVRNGLWLDPGFWRDLPATPGACEGVDRLRRAQHDIYVVTAPYAGCVNWENSRKDALRRLFDIPGSHVIPTEQKHLVYGHFFVDDKVEHVRTWEARWIRHGSRALLFDMPHNRGSLGFERFGWGDELK